MAAAPFRSVARPPVPRSRVLGATGLLLLAAVLPLRAQVIVTARAGNARGGIPDDTTYVDAVIRLELENGPSAVVPALTYNTTLLLPLRQFAEMAELRVAAFALRDSALLLLEPGRVPIRLRPTARVLERGGVPVSYDTLDVIWWDGDLFLASDLLDSLLGTSTRIEWSSLSAVVGRTAGLPVVQRGRRERRRQLMGGDRPTPDVLDLALRQRSLDGAVATWNLTAAARGPSEQMSLELGFGGAVMGGSAELRPVIWTADGASSGEVRGSWWKVWSEGRRVRQVRLGDIQSSGRRARLIQGFSITNAPFIRSSEFDVEQLVTNVPAGWEAELYDRGRLLAFADGAATGAFRVPLQLGYGQNPYELVLYGPGGETVRQQRTIRVPFSRLPRGRFEYAVAGGRCRYEPCDGLLSADARYGLSPRVTLQGGWDALVSSDRPALWQPYALVSGAPLPALALTGEAVVNGHLRAAANYEPSLDLRLNGSVTRFAGAATSGTLTEASRSEASVFWRPGWMRGELYLQGAGVLATGPGLERQMTRLSASTRVGRIRYSAGVLRDGFLRTGAVANRRLAFDAGADAVLMGPWPWLRSASVQGQAAVEPSRGVTAVRTLVGRRVSGRLRMDAGLGWLREAGMTLELAFSTATTGPRVGARSRMSAAGGSEALMYASGSLAWDPRTQLLQLSDAADLNRAGISGVLFRDDNANGVRDPAEPGLAGIPVRIGGWPATTDAEGRFAAWGMFPSEPLEINVDTLSLGNPQYVLPAAVLRVRPAPNAFGAVSVPVVVGAEVSGFVVLNDEALAGVPVILRELNTGVEIRILTFADGGFYRGAVPPGEYEVTLPESVLDDLRAFAPPLSIFVPPGAGEKRYEDLQLRLEPRP